MKIPSFTFCEKANSPSSFLTTHNKPKRTPLGNLFRFHVPVFFSKKKFSAVVGQCNQIVARLLTAVFLCQMAPVNALEKQKILSFKQIHSINEMDTCQPPQTVYFFDIDDTLIDFPTMLGSKAWRAYIKEATKKDLRYNWHDIFSLFVTKHQPVVAVEPALPLLIEKLQKKGYAVFGLTSRERNKWYDTDFAHIDALTEQQLASIGIHLHSDQLSKNLSYLTQLLEYFNGTFFADLEPKGKYLQKVFKNDLPLPPKIIFIDDKLSQVQSVVAFLNERGIPNEGYWYTATDQKAKQFDPLVANIQLYTMLLSQGKQRVTDEEARTIADKFPAKTAQDYLKMILSLGEENLPLF